MDDDLKDVLTAVKTLSSQWILLSLELGLKQSTLDEIESDNPGSVKICLCRALGEWLRLNYNHQRHGRPSWKKLAEAVQTLDFELSEHIANDHTRY